MNIIRMIDWAVYHMTNKLGGRCDYFVTGYTIAWALTMVNPFIGLMFGIGVNYAIASVERRGYFQQEVR